MAIVFRIDSYVRANAANRAWASSDGDRGVSRADARRRRSSSVSCAHLVVGDVCTVGPVHGDQDVVARRAPPAAAGERGRPGGAAAGGASRRTRRRGSRGTSAGGFAPAPNARPAGASPADPAARRRARRRTRQRAARRSRRRARRHGSRSPRPPERSWPPPAGTNITSTMGCSSGATTDDAGTPSRGGRPQRRHDSPPPRLTPTPRVRDARGEQSLLHSAGERRSSTSVPPGRPGTCPPTRLLRVIGAGMVTSESPRRAGWYRRSTTCAHRGHLVGGSD